MIGNLFSYNDYYPFGLEHKGYNNTVISQHKFKYNGKELEESLGYNMYEMDLRSYDPAIARWTAIDPITHHSMSPYNAFDNNPIFWADPSGADSKLPYIISNIWNATNSGTNSKWVNSGNGGFDRVDFSINQGLNPDGSDNSQSDQSSSLVSNTGVNAKFNGFTHLQTNPKHPKKIDFNADDETLLSSVIEWAQYILDNNEEQIFLSDMIIIRERKKRGLMEMLTELGGSSTSNIIRRSVGDGKGNSVTIGYFPLYLKPNSFNDYRIVDVKFTGQLGDSSLARIQFKSHRKNGNSVQPTMFYMNFDGLNFYLNVKNRILE